MLSEIELKLKSKSRKVRLVGILWAIVSGLIFYFVFGFTLSVALTIFVIFLLTVVVLTIIGIALKSPLLIWRNFWIFPFSVIIPIGLNEIVPKWFYPQDGVGFGIGIGMLLCGIYFASCIFATMLVRLCIGYEIAPQFQGKIHSYTFSCQISEVPSFLENLLSHFDISLYTYLREKNYAVLGFGKGSNSFLIYCQDKNGGPIEVDLIAYAQSKDVLIEPGNGDVEVFFAALDGIVKKWKEQGKLEGDIEPNPKFTEQTRDQLLEKYITPIRFEVNFGRIERYLSAVKSFPKNHPHAFAFVVAIMGALVGAVVTILLGK